MGQESEFSKRYLKDEREMNLHGKSDEGVKMSSVMQVLQHIDKLTPPRNTENFFQKWYLQSQQQFFTMSLPLLTPYFSPQ